MNDHAEVVIPPPLLYAIAFVLMLVLQKLAPLTMYAGTAGRWVGILLVATSVAFGLWARRSLATAGTAVNPWRPSSALVEKGPFALSRNPIYVALGLCHLGLAIVCNTLWGDLLILPIVVIMHYGVVLREEAYLGWRFGDSYRQYRSSVGRYF